MSETEKSESQLNDHTNVDDDRLVQGDLSIVDFSPIVGLVENTSRLSSVVKWPEDVTFTNRTDKLVRLIGHVEIPIGLNSETMELVLQFSAVMAKKLYKAQVEYEGRKEPAEGWMNPDREQLYREQLRHHMEKGDPIDVANFCAFMWYHGWSTASDGISEKQPPRFIPE